MKSYSVTGKPLRKVVSKATRSSEKLECGHTIIVLSPKAKRRRCYLCPSKARP